MKYDDIIKKARKCMSLAIEADRGNREEALDDLRFVTGEQQWPDEVLREYANDGRPALTINRLPRFVRQVTGDIRKLNPAVRVLAADNAATDDTAQIMAGLIRQIEQESDASSIYEMAAESAAQCGIGSFRILTEYENENSFDQVIRLEPITNPLSVYWDPAARKSTRADADYCFITDQMSVEDFKAAYPDALASDAEYDPTTDGLEDWQESGDIIVAEYFWREEKSKKIGIMPDGSVTDDPAMMKFAIKTRTTKVKKVMWAKVSGQEVLEGPTEIPSKFIPVVSVTGEEMHVGDRIVRTSVIRFAKEPQQIYNYIRSAETEVTALQPKAPFLVTATQVAGLEKFWNLANQGNKPYLPYNPDPKSPGAPQRIPPPIMSQALAAAVAQAEDDMKATTGIYDAALGGRSNEQSGVAIRQRQLESDISTSIYTDNLSKAIEQAGRIMVDMIPRVYDTERALRIIGEDEEETQVMVNQAFTDISTGQTYEGNILTRGRYDVRVTVGPNYTTRRQETAESMMQFVQAFPAAAQVAGDLIAKSMDWPDADKLAERLKKLLPPGVIGIEDLPEEEQEAAMQAQQQQQAQQQAAMQMAQLREQAEIRRATAEATEAESDAEKSRYEIEQSRFDTEKSRYEVMEQQLQVAAQNGELDAFIGQIVQQQLAAILAGQTGMFPQ